MAHERVRQGRANAQIRARHSCQLAKQVQRQIDRQMQEKNPPAEVFSQAEGVWLDEPVIVTAHSPDVVLSYNAVPDHPLTCAQALTRQKIEEGRVNTPQVVPRTRKVRVA